ncbi:MAG: ABC transporter substrate-binding protein [Arachnia sp.]
MAQTDAATDGTSIYPWQEHLYPAGTPRLDACADELSVEAVAALKPDLIVATAHFGLTEENYAKLSTIAPVVHFDSAANADPWQSSMRKVATALGDESAGDAAVAEAEDRLAEIRAQHPTFEGLTFNAVISPSNDGVWILCSADDNLGRVMSEFGLVLTDFAQSVDCDGGKAQVSWELVPRLDADVLWLIPDTADQVAEVSDQPLWLGLPAVQRGAVAVAPKTEGVPFALAFPSPLSIVWAAEQLAPLIADAVHE